MAATLPEFCKSLCSQTLTCDLGNSFALLGPYFIFILFVALVELTTYVGFNLFKLFLLFFWIWETAQSLLE